MVYLFTDIRIKVTNVHLKNEGLMRGGIDGEDEVGIYKDLNNLSAGLYWVDTLEMEPHHFDAIEDYFLLKQSINSQQNNIEK